MRFRMTIITAALAGIMCLGGCKAASAPATPAPPITGAYNSFDSTAYETLATAHAFVASLISNAATLTAPEKTLLNQLTTDVNAAESVYVAYHTGLQVGAATTTEAQVQTALNLIATDQANLNNSITGSK